MSDTPRTDALVETAESGLQDFGDTFRSAIDLCRSLERELAQAVNGFSEGANSSLDAAIRLADMSAQDIKLMAGEMTASELRAVRAVVKGIVARITALREATK